MDLESHVDDRNASEGILKALNAYIKYSKIRILLLTQEEIRIIKNDNNIDE